MRVITPSLGSLKQDCEFEAGVDYIVRSCLRKKREECRLSDEGRKVSMGADAAGLVCLVGVRVFLDAVGIDEKA